MTIDRPISLGHSPDSDDAFMFYGLTQGKIETEGLTFTEVLEDIQTLNEWARQGRLDLTAVSLHAYPYIADKYAILAHGASMGYGYGPTVVARRSMTRDDLRQVLIAVPGTLTTAFLALRLYLPEVRYTVLPFDQILEAVERGDVEAGLLIHEGQLTHAAQGLHTIVDLGAWWGEQTGGLPLPLGVNVVRRDLGTDVMQRLARVMKRTIEYALTHRDEALGYALGFARGLETDLADRFVGMYVNEGTRQMGEPERRGIEELLGRGAAAGLIPDVGRVDFVSAE